MPNATAADALTLDDKPFTGQIRSAADRGPAAGSLEPAPRFGVRGEVAHRPETFATQHGIGMTPYGTGPRRAAPFLRRHRR